MSRNYIDCYIPEHDALDIDAITVETCEFEFRQNFDRISIKLNSKMSKRRRTISESDSSEDETCKRPRFNTRLELLEEESE